MAVFLIFFSFWGVFAIFGGTDYQANTDSLKQAAPELFTELSRIDYPENAELMHASVSTWGCLLYTSPSPRDRTRSRMPSSA